MVFFSDPLYHHYYVRYMVVTETWGLRLHSRSHTTHVVISIV